jgi:DNA-binding transcriptional MerR regulator
VEDKKQVMVNRLIQHFQENDFTINEILESLELAKVTVFSACKVKV